jgi:hypothetical protein
MIAPAVLLHGSLLVRVVLGDVRGLEWAWQLGGFLNIVSVLLFAAVAAWSAATASTARRTHR